MVRTSSDPRRSARARAAAWPFLAVLSGMLPACATGRVGGWEPSSQEESEQAAPAVSEVDRRILAAVADCLMPVAEGRAKWMGGVEGELDVVLDSALLDALCEAESVAGLIGRRSMEEYGVAVRDMERRAAPELSWLELGTDWLRGKPWIVYPTSTLPRGYPPSWKWLRTFFPDADAYMALSLPGVDPAAGLAVVRFVAGPSAHGFDGVVLLRLHEGEWRCSHVQESLGF